MFLLQTELCFCALRNGTYSNSTIHKNFNHEKHTFRCTVFMPVDNSYAISMDQNYPYCYSLGGIWAYSLRAYSISYFHEMSYISKAVFSHLINYFAKNNSSNKIMIKLRHILPHFLSIFISMLIMIFIEFSTLLCH